MSLPFVARSYLTCTGEVKNVSMRICLLDKPIILHMRCKSELKEKAHADTPPFPHKRWAQPQRRTATPIYKGTMGA